MQFIGRADKVTRQQAVKHQMMRSFGSWTQGRRQGAALLFELHHELGQRHRVGRTRWRATLQAGERQQIADQHLHAAGLLRHQVQVTHTLGLIELQGLQGLDKTGQHRQRRANFVRDVGDKIAAHCLGLLERSDVARDQQQPSFAIRVQVHRQLDRPRRRTLTPRHDEILLIIMAGKISGKARVAYQIAQVLLQIAFRLETKMCRCHLVEPFDLPACIEQHNAVGGSLKCGQKILQALLAVPSSLLAQPKQTPHPVRHLAPQTGAHRRVGGIAHAQPAQQVRAARGIQQEPQNTAQHHTDQSADPLAAGCLCE